MTERKVDLTNTAVWLSGEALAVLAEKHGFDPENQSFRQIYQEFVEESVSAATINGFLPLVFENYLRRRLEDTSVGRGAGN